MVRLKKATNFLARRYKIGDAPYKTVGRYEMPKLAPLRILRRRRAC